MNGGILVMEINYGLGKIIRKKPFMGKSNLIYLFNNSFTNNSKNLEKTIAKLDKMSQLGFIPRNN